MILVTGSEGLIGNRICEVLAEQNIGFGMCDPRRPKTNSAAYWMENYAGIITAVFHLGAISDTTCDDMEALWATNVQLSIDLARFCEKKKIPFIYASSAAVYGNGNGPLNPYAWSKAYFDEWMGDRIDTPWYACRFFNVYGPGEDHKGKQASMIHQMYEAMNDGERPRLFALDARRDFIHIDDVVAIMLWMWREKPAYGLYDVGSGHNYSFEYVFDTLEKVLEISQGYDEIPMPESLVGRYQFETRANTAKMREQTGPWTMMSLREGIDRFVSSRTDRTARLFPPQPAQPPRPRS